MAVPLQDMHVPMVMDQEIAQLAVQVPHMTYQDLLERTGHLQEDEHKSEVLAGKLAAALGTVFLEWKKRYHLFERYEKTGLLFESMLPFEVVQKVCLLVFYFNF